MPAPGKPQFIVPIQEVLAATMGRDDILQGGNRKKEAEKSEKQCGRRREENIPWRYITKPKVLSMVPHFPVTCLP